MARIPGEVVERLKAEVSVQRLAEARGVELTRHGADLHGRCPFHDDRTPSLVITPAKEPMALPGSLSGWRYSDRLGDESRRYLVPARGGAVAK